MTLELGQVTRYVLTYANEYAWEVQMTGGILATVYEDDTITYTSAYDDDDMVDFSAYDAAVIRHVDRHHLTCQYA